MRHSFFSLRFVLLFAIAVGAVVALTFSFAPSHEADAAALELHGWAWSSNIGWISFNCADISGLCTTSDYRVTYDNVSGNLSGYAWNSGTQGTQSGGIGWIRFNPSETGCLVGTCPPKVASSGTDRQVMGWARACSVFVSNCAGALKPDSERGGWDGWIELSGTNHTSPNITSTGGVTYRSGLSKFVGKAWGGDPIGWLDFDGVTLTVPPPLPAADIRANGSNGPISILQGSSAELTWCGSPGVPCLNATSCTVSPSPVPAVIVPGISSGLPGTYSTGPLSSSQTYTLTCSNTSGQTSDSVTVNVTASCTDECSPSGATQCADVNSWEQCGNYDADSCLEWGPPNSCPVGQTCSGGACVVTESADFTLSFDVPLTVNFSPGLLSQSSTTTVSALPSGGFNSDINLSVVDILDPATGLSTSTLNGFYTPVFNPDSVLSSGEYSVGAEFKMLVHKSRANKNHEQNFLVVVRGSGASVQHSINIPLKLKASGSGSGNL